MKTIATIFLGCITFFANAAVTTVSNNPKIPARPVQLFSTSGVSWDRSMAESGVFLNLRQKAVDSLLQQKPTRMQVNIPSPQGSTWLINLSQASFLSDQFVVNTSSGAKINASEILQNAAFYQGKLAGYEQSFASLSIFRGEVMGVVSFNGQVYDIGAYQAIPQRRHVLYESSAINRQLPFDCQAMDPAAGEMQMQQANLPAWNCTRVFRNYFECDYHMFTSRQNSVSNVVNYVTGMFNVVNQLFANESLVSQISEIFVWNTPDPYTSSSNSNQYLAAFRNTRTSFSGDLAHLLSTRGTNFGGIAYLSVLCAPSIAYAYSNINNSYNNLPTYSWTINVVTHEIGHNLGSPHTHRCSWPGGAIDNCATTEGGCPQGPAPVGGGTIMSYCHLTSSGVNFNNGFGPLPGNLIRSRVNGANCLAVAPGSSTIALNCVPTTANPGNNTNCGPVRVQLNTIEHFSSGAFIGPFEDFTCNTSTELGIGNTYTLAVSTNTNPQNVRAFIDYNANGNFETTERVLLSTGNASSQTHTQQFTVPTTALTNTWLRMRVVADFGTNTEPLPCEQLDFGQAEDYRILIVPSAFYPGEIAPGDQILCSGGDPVNINFSVAPAGATGYSYQWYSRIGSISPPVTGNSTSDWTLINGATASSYNPPAGLTQSTSFACLVTPTGGTARWAQSSRKISIPSSPFVGFIPQGNQSFTSSGDPNPIVLNGEGGTFKPDSGQGGVAGPVQWYYAPGIQPAPTGSVIPSNWIAITGATSATYDPPVQSASISYCAMVDPGGNPDCFGFTWVSGVRQITISNVFSPGTLADRNESFCHNADPQNIVFAVNPSGASAYTYQWYFQNGLAAAPIGSSTAGWTLISGASSANYDPPAGLTQSRSYACFVTPSGGSGQWATGVRQVSVLPAFSAGTVASGNQSFSGSGDPSNITFSTAPSGGSGTFAYRWYSRLGIHAAPTGTTVPAEWTLISGATSSGYDPPLQSASISFAAMVDPTGTPDCGPFTWAGGVRQITITITTFSPGVLATGNQTICNAGDPSNIIFSTTATTGSTFQWYFQNGIIAAPAATAPLTGWTSISGATASSYDPPSGLTANRTYACRVTNGSNSQWASGVRQITVLPVFNPGSLIVNQTGCGAYNPASITMAINPQGSGAYQWRWYYQENITVACPPATNPPPTAWITSTTDGRFFGTSTTGAGIFFDPSSSGNNGRTWTLLITPTSNGSIPACGTAQYATTCHRTIRQVCRIGNADTLGPVAEKLPWLGDAFPNPANETVQIPYYLPDENSKAEISLFSTTGQVIADYACMGGSERMLTIDLTHLSPGVYFYSLRSNQAKLLTRKLIVQ